MRTDVTARGHQPQATANRERPKPSPQRFYVRQAPHVLRLRTVEAETRDGRVDGEHCFHAVFVVESAARLENAHQPVYRGGHQLVSVNRVEADLEDWVIERVSKLDDLETRLSGGRLWRRTAA